MYSRIFKPASGLLLELASFIILLCIVLFGAQDVRSETSGKDIKVIAFAQDTLANDWRRAQVRELEQALADMPGIKFISSNANGEVARQIKDIEDFVYSDVDVLITSPRNAELMVPVADKVMAKRIPLVLISRSVASDNYTSFIHPDNRKIAGQAARFIAKRLMGKGKVLMLQHIPTTTPAIHRTEGFLEALKEFPGVIVVDTRVANSQRAEAIVQTEQAILEGVKFDAIYAQSDSMAVGAIMALKKNGIDPRGVVITGIDYISEARKLIRSGELAASYTYPTGGREGARVALDILSGKSVDKEIVIESTEVTTDNVEQVEPIF